MTFLSYSLAAIVAWSGLLMGAVLALNTKEEMPTARKYFPLMQRIVIVLIVALVLDFFKVGLLIKIAVYALLLWSLLKAKVPNFYIITGLFFFLIGQSSQTLFLIAALLFLYGFPTGSRVVVEHGLTSWKQAFKKIFRRYGVFLVISIGLQFAYTVFVLKKF